jgi:glutaredoxin
MGSARINAVRQRLAFDIDTGYDEVMTDAAESDLTEGVQHNRKYDPKTKRFTEEAGKRIFKPEGGEADYKTFQRKFCKHCAATSDVLFKKLGGADKGFNVVEGSFIYGEGQARNHRWVRDDQGTIYDASRDQFGDTLKIHKINPRDPKYKKYMENSVIKGNTPLGGEKLYELGLNNNKRKIRFNRRYDLRHDQIFNEETGKRKPLAKTLTKGMKAIFGKSARIQMARERLKYVRRT